MSKKMWNKIFKSKTNKNSKTLQAANKINKRSSIYEEYQQLNAALDIEPINEKLNKDTSKKPTTTFAALLNDTDEAKRTKIEAATTKLPQTTATTFSKVVNTLTLKRALSSNSGKDLKNATGNGNGGKEKNSKKSEFETITTGTLRPEQTINQSNSSSIINCNNNNNSTVTNEHCSNSNCNFNTSYNASLNQQQPQLTENDTATAASLNLKLNNNNINIYNNEYLACKQNLTNPPLQQQKRLSKIVIVVKKLDAATPLPSTTAKTAATTATEIATNLNNQIYCTNNSSTNKHFYNIKNVSLEKNNNATTAVATTFTLKPSIGTTATSLPNDVLKNENQWSINLNNNSDPKDVGDDHHPSIEDRKFYLNKFDNGNNITPPTEVPETNTSVELVPCPICSRTFNPGTLRKHVGICEKMTTKKRNKFDSSRQRREGTDLATYPLPKNFGLPEKTTSSSSIAQARNDRGQSPKPAAQQVSSPIMTRKKLSEDLIRSTARASMRKAAATTTTPVATSTPIYNNNFNRDRMRSSERSLTRRGTQPPPAEQCPHCERCFGIKAYDRHVEWCKEKALLASIKQGNSKNDGSVAKARLEARTKYRAPCLKTKRSMNREKYSGLAGDETSEVDDSSKCSKTSLNKTQENSLMSMSMTSSMCSERKISKSTTGNINEPIAATEVYENKRKCLRDKTKAVQPPTRAATAAVTEEVQNEKAIINLEIQIPELHLMGEKNVSINKKRNTKATKTNLNTATKIKPQKGQQQQRPIEYLNNLQTKPKQNYYKRNSMDVEMKLPPLPIAPVLEPNKSNSHLSLKSLRSGKSRKVSETNNNHNYHYYDNVVSSDIDAVQLEANTKSIKNLDLSKKSSSLIMDSNMKMILEEYFEKKEIYDLENHDHDHDRYHQDLTLQQLDYNKFDELSSTYDSEESGECDRPKRSVNTKSEEKHLYKHLSKQTSNKTEQKDIELNNNTRKVGCLDVGEHVSLPGNTTNLKFCQEYFKTQECHSKLEIYKDCLTDSDELRRQKQISKENVFNEKNHMETTEIEFKDAQLEENLKLLKSSSKSDSFLNETNYKLVEQKDNYEETSQRQDTPRRCCLSSPASQLSTLPIITTKTDSSRIKSLKMCQPKRKKVLRQTENRSNASFPMKAIMLPLSMENLQICGISSTPLIEGNSKIRNIRALGYAEESIENEKVKCSVIQVENEETITCVLDKEIKVIKEPPQLKRNRSFTVIGLPDNYDPFLSAKRQLEELCSPLDESVDIPTTPQTPQLPTMPTTPNSISKMSTSLILSSSTPNTTPSLMTTSQIQPQTQKTPILARSTSFRRTSSLRGPRRSPILTTRPPLFAQKHRPTIQRGLSDEGPISTNFLKPEEYDEMPVRSVCVNDFAVNKSPRVVRRDTSTSNRKQPLKLNINAAHINCSSNTVSPNVMESEVMIANTSSKYVSKTDSLAVFLKFEHELEKLNNSATDSEPKMDNLLDVKTPSTSSTITPPLSNLDGPLNAKALKDKSNNLSKQNSAKNIKADILAVNDTTENYNKNVNTNSQMSPNDIETGKYGQVRLAPLATKSSTPLTKPNTPQLTQQHTFAPQLKPLNIKSSLTHNQEQSVHKSPKPVALSSIFGSHNKNTKQQTLQSYNSECKNSIGLDYIDPKLINKCDNLPINLNPKRTDCKQSDSDTSETRLEHFSSSSSSECAAPAKKTTSQPQHAKFLPTVKQEQQQPELSEQNNSNINQNHLPLSITNSQRNSAEGRSLLKRRMRLGRNQFLYDASPEGDSCSADDEGANRSSMEGEASQQHYTERENAFERLSSVPVTSTDTPFIPPLPAFDDFDFEEFLSSFENDEEQFPLFKDCREFLMNRTSKKQRSMLVPNAATQNINTNSHNSTNLKKSPSPQIFPPLTPQTHPNAGHHFQFPTLSQHPKQLFNSFSVNTNRARNNYDDLTATNSTDTFCINSQTEEYKELESQSLDKKREIFISIETEQNDLDKSSISPNSIRNMVGNPQTVVEVEVDAAHDNKFSKISDDDDTDTALHNCRNKNFTGHLAAKHLPNVQLNNAKNLMQKIQEGFHQAGEEMSSNLRLSMEHRTAPVNVNTNSSMSGNARNVININRLAGTPSGDAYGDSDELSSLDGYPLSSPNSRLGVSSKTSADSAYGSLSRQRSSELSTQRSSSRNRPMTSNATNTLLNRPLTEETSLGRSRQLSASSSSSSEHGLPLITNNSSSFHKLQQHQQQHLYNNNNINNNSNNNDLDDRLRYELNNNNYDVQSAHTNLTGATNSHSNLESLQQYTSNSTMSTSMKMSKFCHECGNKFLLEQAKFCMDCGVKRIVL